MLWDGSNKGKKTNQPTKDPNLPVLRMGALLWTHSFWDKQFLGEMESPEIWVRQRRKAESRWGIRAVHTGRGRGDLDLHHKAEVIVFLHFTPKYTHRTRGSEESSHPGSCKIPGDWSEPPPCTPQGLLGVGGISWQCFTLVPIERVPRHPVCLFTVVSGRPHFFLSPVPIQAPLLPHPGLRSQREENNPHQQLGREDGIGSPCQIGLHQGLYYRLFCFRWTWFNPPFT